MARPVVIDPQERVLDAIDGARVALGVMAPLTSMQRRSVRNLLSVLGIPHRPGSGAAPDSDSS